ncbi:hypothetical protein BCV70DRAFT_32374 [Testicularia cyperi]|uniref:Uncharacterized protein n=1 Tax=Testicularia cyperi TaxID=1882483 RepID=A0A317XMB3_9BASI|nr:hypothetical protein BCV70DRAFT_32374 [Testicularia cyperi]
MTQSTSTKSTHLLMTNTKHTEMVLHEHGHGQRHRRGRGLGALLHYTTRVEVCGVHDWQCKRPHVDQRRGKRSKIKYEGERDGVRASLLSYERQTMMSTDTYTGANAKKQREKNKKGQQCCTVQLQLLGRGGERKSGCVGDTGKLQLGWAQWRVCTLRTALPPPPPLVSSSVAVLSCAGLLRDFLLAVAATFEQSQQAVLLFRFAFRTPSIPCTVPVQYQEEQKKSGLGWVGTTVQCYDASSPLLFSFLFFLLLLPRAVCRLGISPGSLRSHSPLLQKHKRQNILWKRRQSSVFSF